MPRTFARVDDVLVVDVQSATCPVEAAALFGGDPLRWFNADSATGTATIGQGWDWRFSDRYADVWQQPVPGIDEPFALGDVRFHVDRFWRSRVDGNVWEPGVAGWSDLPAAGYVSVWAQPSAIDYYRMDEVVTHNGGTWRSINDVNVWEPGVSQWVQIDLDPNDTAWITGRSYAIGDFAVYQLITYRCIQAHTSQPNWKPSTTSALWAVV